MGHYFLDRQHASVRIFLCAFFFLYVYALHESFLSLSLSFVPSLFSLVFFLRPNFLHLARMFNMTDGL